MNIKHIVGDISKSGTTSATTYIEKKAGGGGTEYDCWMRFLNAQGFGGHPRDALRKWAQSVGANSGTLYDNLRNYFNKTVNP